MKEFNQDGKPRKVRVKSKKSDEEGYEDEVVFSKKEQLKRIKEFWKYDLNPITGQKRETTKRFEDSAPTTTYYLER